MKTHQWIIIIVTAAAVAAIFGYQMRTDREQALRERVDDIAIQSEGDIAPRMDSAPEEVSSATLREKNSLQEMLVFWEKAVERHQQKLEAAELPGQAALAEMEYKNAIESRDGAKQRLEDFRAENPAAFEGDPPQWAVDKAKSDERHIETLQTMVDTSALTLQIADTPERKEEREKNHRQWIEKLEAARADLTEFRREHGIQESPEKQEP